MRNTAWVLIALGAAILVGVGYWLFHTSDEAPLIAGDEPAAASERVAGGAQVRHPITPPPAAPAEPARRPEAGAEVAATPRPRATPLPELEQSDAPLLSDAQPCSAPAARRTSCARRRSSSTSSSPSTTSIAAPSRCGGAPSPTYRRSRRCAWSRARRR